MSQHLDRPVQLNLLGEFQLIVEGVDKTPSITYSKPKLLLALLALSLDKKSSRVVLADMLWPQGGGSARPNLRHALCMLRQVLGPTLAKALIQSTASTLALNQDLMIVDALVVCGMAAYPERDLVERLQYDRGVLLDGLVPKGYADLSAWRVGWQSRLAQEISQSRQTYIAQLCAQGEVQAALASARLWVATHPNDEHAHRALIRLLRESGQHEAAIKAYEHCVAVMGEHYGTAPAAETRALLEVGESSGQVTLLRNLNPKRDVKNTRPQGEQLRNVPACTKGARPLAVLAVAITYQGEDMPGEAVLTQVHQARERLIRLARATGRRVCLGADGNLGIMFGYPNLNERPTEAAAHFAYHIQRFLMAPGIAFCMGIHADLVSMLLPDQGSLPIMLISQRASRLAYLAAPGETLLTEAAQTRLSDHFLVRLDERFGLHVGILARQYDTVNVHRMFGRSVEFDMLVARWNNLEALAQPLVMFLGGESGMGKSLLAQVFAEYVRHSRGGVIMLRCDQENHQTALHPFQQFFFQKLSTHKESSDPDRMAGALRAMESLGYRVGLDKNTSMSLANYFVAMHTVVAQKEDREGLTPEALIAPLISFLLHREAPEQPLLLILDDIQWADTVTLSLLHTLLRQIRRQPTMLLLGGRALPPNIPIDVTMTLRPLGRDAMAKMVNYWVRDKRLAPRLRRSIVEKSQGVPLYAEEMVRQYAPNLDLNATPLMRDLCAVRALSEAQDKEEAEILPESADALPFWEVS